jgi:hypothetical protein
MGFQPRIRSRRATNHEYTKSLREKRGAKNQTNKPIRQLAHKESVTAQVISEVTLKRLHTLGNQKFGTFPFSEHFDRWLTNVVSVLSEFESNPNMAVDDQFVEERSQTLASIESKLELQRCKEVALGKAVTDLSNCKNLLKGLKNEYVYRAVALRRRKTGELRSLYGSINRLKKDEEQVIQIKTGLFRGVSKREREQKEIEITQELAEKQRALELAMLNFNKAKEDLQEEYESKRAPMLEQLKKLQKTVDEAEVDGSLEERWFACQTFIDSVNTFLQRHACRPN